jgi:hypothetical protein
METWKQVDVYGFNFNRVGLGLDGGVLELDDWYQATRGHRYLNFLNGKIFSSLMRQKRMKLG